ncbi:hypothetical protein BS47DRAFT_1293938, partial [Hydnum rufescens UP504]
MSYPFALHSIGRSYDWDLHIVNHQLHVQSRSCTGTRIQNGAGSTNSKILPCDKCHGLSFNSNLMGIQHRISRGTHENTTNAYLPIAALWNKLNLYRDRINNLRLLHFNAHKRLASCMRTMAEYNRFMMAIASGSVQRIGALVRVALRNGSAIGGILRKIDDAAGGLYKPKDYTEKEKMRAVLFYRLGGARVAEFAYCSSGLPSLRTTQQYSRLFNHPLRPSPSNPLITEIQHNIDVTFVHAASEPVAPDLGDTRIVAPYYVLMVDEIKVEERPCWDSETNKILGICREHSAKLSLDFCLLDDLEIICNALAEGGAHVATEATVVAIGMMSKDTRVYGSRPILISGSCKRESASEHAKILNTVIMACHSRSDILSARMLCIASDGESRRGSALVQITCKAMLHENSPIYPLLHLLPLMNLLVGDDDITCDKDYKHVLKRLRMLLIREAGTFIGDIHITPAVTRAHLVSNGMPGYQASYLLNPHDKQDVVLALKLLKAIWELPPPSDLTRPGFASSRTALNTLGKLFYHTVIPYLDTQLSLKEQLQHLSTAAHIALFLYTWNSARTKFMPTQLYSDLMIMIKNAYFCIAKVKIMFPNMDHDFYLVLLGTDRLEVSFGILRTMIGNDCNADVLQLSSRLSNVTECATILAEHPEWDRSPRRLHLKPITSPDTVTQKSDHINPASWLGDVNVKEVVLATCWKLGRINAEKICPIAKQHLEDLEANTNVDILQPFG